MKMLELWRLFRFYKKEVEPMLKRFLGNSDTSLAGILGVVLYFASALFPDHAAVLKDAAFALLGGGLLAAKDARTGSAP